MTDFPTQQVKLQLMMLRFIDVAFNQPAPLMAFLLAPMNYDSGCNHATISQLSGAAVASKTMHCITCMAIWCNPLQHIAMQWNGMMQCNACHCILLQCCLDLTAILLLAWPWAPSNKAEKGHSSGVDTGISSKDDSAP